ncbi:MAG: IPT/TIG domain-containing protein, partial [Candidatus Hydrogenedentota bacterium]
MTKLGRSSWFIISLLTIAMIVPTSPTFAAGTLRPSEHPAKIVIGADDMNSIGVAGCSANRFDFNSSGNWFAVTPDGKLLVADRQNHRVVVFNSIPTTNGANADYAIGQDNLDDRFLHRGNVDADNNPQPCAWGLYEPIAVAVGPNGQIAIGDRGNMRIVIYNKLPTKEEVAAKKPADLVLGQMDFKTRGGNKTRWGLSDCEDVAFHGNDLVVCDREANRIMIWKDITKLTNGAAPLDADIVLGQKDWTTIDLAADQGGLQAPRGIAVGNNGEVIVCGHAQHRVCIWKTFPTSFTEGTPILPDMLLGQTSLAGTDASDGPSGVNSPRCAAVSPTGQLAIGDFGNNRVLIWDNFPTTKGQAADRVLGDSDLNGNANTPAHPSTYDNRTLSSPSGVEWGANGTLLVCNASGEFIKVFDPDFFVELPNYAGRPEISPKAALVPAGAPVQLTVAKGMPPFTWAMIPNGQPEGYCPTTFDAATGIVTPGLWSIHQSDNFVPQLFTVKDSRGDVDTAELRVFPPLSARVDQSPLYAGQSSYVNASGGVSPYYGPWSFAIVENNSGGSVNPSEYGNSAYQETYKAGDNPGKDVIEVTDSAGNKARAEVTVGTPPTVSPANPTVNRSGTIQFSFTGGMFPPEAYGRSWMMVENNTGGSIGFQDGLYTAGPIGGKDVIALHEVNGYLAKVTVNVFQPAPVITSATLASGKQTGGSLFTIYGSNFDEPLTVTVGGINATVQSVFEKAEISV